ncbi:small acid-soluble spore protein P (minor) [Salirhabdus euzebyi]|uniref:Small acid-soluble spore protein P (Minor) n=1 Tax=Salirhabdus euzebyi TaxID=394506 RepID=A0A841PVG1_9BACI|nr:small acid-soluble spore protein P [Salirhabdus euzebyi]MBB6452810.1 small acid-soluble spore protein P (minor) [Salirhabdus euzebyi]
MAEQKNSKLHRQASQPYGVPMKGSKKVKNRNHSRQKKGASHDM